MLALLPLSGWRNRSMFCWFDHVSVNVDALAREIGTILTYELNIAALIIYLCLLVTVVMGNVKLIHVCVNASGL